MTALKSGTVIYAEQILTPKKDLRIFKTCICTSVCTHTKWGFPK